MRVGGEAARVRCAGVATERIVIIRNAISMARFGRRETSRRAALQKYFTRPPEMIVGAAGRLSPEKGFDVLVRTAAQVASQTDRVGFVVFGEGAERPALERQIAAAGLQERFILAGFTSDLDALLPALDVMALPSFTEGLPNVVLEAFAAGLPVVATAVGGVPEVLDDGVSGFLAPAADHAALARDPGTGGRLRLVARRWVIAGGAGSNASSHSRHKPRPTKSYSPCSPPGTPQKAILRSAERTKRPTWPAHMPSPTLTAERLPVGQARRPVRVCFLIDRLARWDRDAARRIGAPHEPGARRARPVPAEWRRRTIPRAGAK